MPDVPAGIFPHGKTLTFDGWMHWGKASGVDVRELFITNDVPAHVGVDGTYFISADEVWPLLPVKRFADVLHTLPSADWGGSRKGAGRKRRGQSTEDSTTTKSLTTKRARNASEKNQRRRDNL